MMSNDKPEATDTPVIRAMWLFVVLLNYTGLLWISGAIPWHSPKMIERLVSYVQ